MVYLERHPSIVLDDVEIEYVRFWVTRDLSQDLDTFNYLDTTGQEHKVVVHPPRLFCSFQDATYITLYSCGDSHSVPAGEVRGL